MNATYEIRTPKTHSSHRIPPAHLSAAHRRSIQNRHAPPMADGRPRPRPPRRRRHLFPHRPMIILRDLTENPCREIIEGRQRLRTVRTIPYLPPQLKPCPPRKDCAAEFAPMRPIQPVKYHDLEAYIAKFRAHILSRPPEAREFTARETAIFFCDLGWKIKNPVAAASAKLAKLIRAGTVINIGRLRTGMRSHAIRYQFI